MGKVETLTGADQLLDRSVMAIGGTQITLGTIIAAVVILVLAIFASWVVHLVVGRAQKRVGDAHIPLIYIGGQIARYIIVFAGISIAISTLGVDLSALSLFAGALGVGIGLGLQDIVKNFVCGIILLFDRSIEVGDYIELEDGSAGLVEAMGDRFITRILAQKDVRQVERKGECDLVLRLADFTLPRLTLTFAEPKAALKAATWLTGNQDA